MQRLARRIDTCGFDFSDPESANQTEDTVSKKVFIKTYGCQMNEYDSDKMVDLMHAAEGYERTDNPEEADLVLFNT